MTVAVAVGAGSVVGEGVEVDVGMAVAVAVGTGVEVGVGDGVSVGCGGAEVGVTPPSQAISRTAIRGTIPSIQRTRFRRILLVTTTSFFWAGGSCCQGHLTKIQVFAVEQLQRAVASPRG